MTKILVLACTAVLAPLHHKACGQVQAGRMQLATAYDQGYAAGQYYPISWANEVGFLTKAELVETAEVQAYHATQYHLINKKDYDQFVAGWLEGFLALHAKTIRD